MVLIKTMNMPTSCGVCKFHSYGAINEFEVLCLLTGEKIGHYDDCNALNKRRADCPLIFVEPMRCADCFVPCYYNLEDDDSICRDCEVGE